MVSSDSSFAKYSKSLCWIVSVIALLVSGFVFTSDSPAATINGLLWFGLAAVFALSAVMVGRSGSDAGGSGSA